MHIRPLQPGDEEGVASLWQYWFRDKTRTPAPGLSALVRRLYLEHPYRPADVAPLVAEGDDGAVLGFLGVTATPVVLDGREAVLAGVFPSVVAPEAPTTVASFLLRRFLAGPQAFTLSDGGHVKFERIWEGLGGAIAQLQSLRWVKLLRPLELGVSLGMSLAVEPSGGRPLRARAAGWAAGLAAGLAAVPARGGDRLARWALPSRLRAPPSRWTTLPLTAEGLGAAAEAVHAGARLRPVYGPAYARWLLDELARDRSQGALAAREVRGEDGALAGWYVAYLRPGGVGRVFALEAHPRRLEGVVDRLFADADAAGVAALIGRLQPALRRPLAARGCLVFAGGALQMVHARDRSLVDDALLGRLAFTRLEGENWYWWHIIAHTVA